MSAENDFLPFASASGANVLTQAQYAALAAVLNGFSSGTASSAAVNKALRQGTVMAAALASFIVAQTGADVIDDGTTDTIAGSIASSVISLSRHGLADNVYYGGTPASGVNPGFTRTLTFVAPCNGFVLAVQAANCSAQQPGAMQNFLSITGSISGSTSVSDQTLFPMTNTTTRAVQAGETVSVTGLLNTDATAGSWYNVGINLSYIFVPSL